MPSFSTQPLPTRPAFHFSSPARWLFTRRMAVSCGSTWIATVGNYDYGFNWIFHQDGTLEMRVLLTGIMETKGVDLASESHNPSPDMAYGHLVDRNLLAVHHQHF